MLPTMAIILHITRRIEWEKATAKGRYEPASLQKQGFIHCSMPEQIIRVANSHFRGKRGLMLLCIDTEKVTADIRYESPDGGPEQFPHIYGVLNIDAVVNVVDFKPAEDGIFSLPPH